jgi:alpha-glucosidase (family GH31 glycosyl hydrolase)
VERYEVPESVVPRPPTTKTETPEIEFKYSAEPFSFSILRAKSDEVLFSTEGHPLIFEPQYIRVKTSLPANPNIYGLGEHTDSFRLPTNNYTRTLWSRDAYGVPNATRTCTETIPSISSIVHRLSWRLPSQLERNGCQDQPDRRCFGYIPRVQRHRRSDRLYTS